MNESSRITEVNESAEATRAAAEKQAEIERRRAVTEFKVVVYKYLASMRKGNVTDTAATCIWSRSRWWCVLESHGSVEAAKNFLSKIFIYLLIVPSRQGPGPPWLSELEIVFQFGLTLSIVPLPLSISPSLYLKKINRLPTAGVPPGRETTRYHAVTVMDVPHEPRSHRHPGQRRRGHQSLRCPTKPFRLAPFFLSVRQADGVLRLSNAWQLFVVSEANDIIFCTQF